METMFELIYMYMNIYIYESQQIMIKVLINKTQNYEHNFYFIFFYIIEFVIKLKMIHVPYINDVKFNLTIS